MPGNIVTSWARGLPLNPQARRFARRAIPPAIGSIKGADSPHEVAITFDDGPDPDVTPGLLRLLRELDVTVTFFVLLTQCRRFPDLLAAMVSDGHEIGLHGIDHRPITTMRYTQAVDHLTAARRELMAISGQRVGLYRPPYGLQSVSSRLAAHRAGMDVVMWSSHGPDWLERDVESIVRDAMSALRPGGILLLHERLEPSPLECDPPRTTFDRIDLTRRLISRITQKGWRISPVGRMVAGSGACRTLKFGQ